MAEDKQSKSLSDAEIVTGRPAGRRRFLGLMAVGGIAAGAGTLIPTGSAHAADIDNGTWIDRGSCARGPGGVWSGVTDSDDGAISDAAGHGRGAPYC